MIKAKKEKKEERKISIITIFLFLFLITTFSVVTITKIRNEKKNALESVEENVNNDPIYISKSNLFDKSTLEDLQLNFSTLPEVTVTGCDSSNYNIVMEKDPHQLDSISLTFTNLEFDKIYDYEIDVMYKNCGTYLGRQVNMQLVYSDLYSAPKTEGSGWIATTSNTKKFFWNAYGSVDNQSTDNEWFLRGFGHFNLAVTFYYADTNEKIFLENAYFSMFSLDGVKTNDEYTHAEGISSKHATETYLLTNNAINRLEEYECLGELYKNVYHGDEASGMMEDGENGVSYRFQNTDTIDVEMFVLYGIYSSGYHINFKTMTATIPNEPRKIVSKDEVKLGEEITYTIEQDLPESSIDGFYLESFGFEDKLDNSLEFKSLHVYDENGNDVTSYGTISIDNNVLKYTFSLAYLTSISYKGQTYRFEILAEVVEESSGLSPEEKILQAKVEQKISDMTLREKIGQMLVISNWKFGYNDELDNLLKTVKPGGFILFDVNIGTYDQTVDYISKVKETANIPMFIGVDQEGGRVQRVKNISDANVLTIPYMFDVGLTNNPKLSYQVGKVIAEEISAFGFNLDFAPSLDIFSNPNNTVIAQRAFGNDAKTVAKMALPLSQGIKDSGVIPVYKHFPGHGDTSVDSHVALPVVNKTKDELYQNELLPFKAAIENGAEVIMTAHIALPQITGDYTPATLSNEVITGILREELGFKGVVTTDAVSMKALADNYTPEEIYKKAILAGIDMILMPSDAVEAINIIENLINSGIVTEERINESVKRILIMKYRNNLDNEKEPSKDKIGTQEHIDIINKVPVITLE